MSAGIIFHGENAVGIARTRGALAPSRNDATARDVAILDFADTLHFGRITLQLLPLGILLLLCARIGYRFELGHRRVAGIFQLELVLIEWVCRKEEAHQLLLAIKTLQRAPLLKFLGWFGMLNHHIVLLQVAKEAHLVRFLVSLEFLPVFDYLVEEGNALGIGSEILFAADLAKAIQCARQCQRLKCLAVDRTEIYAFHQVENVLEGAIGIALLHHSIGCTFAKALDSSQSETHGTFGIDRIALTREVDVGSLHREADSTAFVHLLGQFVHIVQRARKHSRHILGWIVSLEIGRLVSHPGVADGMALVEGVGGKLLPVAPDLLKHLRVVSILRATFDELGLHSIDDILLLLAHGLSEGIRLATRKVGQQARQQHDLLLIDRDAVGILQVLLHDGDVVSDGFAAILAGNERRDVVHRARTIEGVHGHNVADAVGLQLLEVLLHTGRFELERSHGASCLEEFVGQFVIDWNLFDIDFDASCLADVVERFVDNAQRLEAKEVHLDESRRFDDVSIVLGYEQLCPMVIYHRNRHYLVDWVTSDNHAAGMHARTAHIALEHLPETHHIANGRIVAFTRFPQFGHHLDAVL